MMKKLLTLIFITTSILLSGCLYPEAKLEENTVPYEDQIQRVQDAVNQYKEKTEGLIPIKTKDYNTPIYEKYPIDFKLISPKYMGELPGNAYENGGVYQYVLVHVESNPTVKLLDLRVAERIQQLQMRIDIYRDKYQYPPFKEVISNGVYSIDYKRLKIEEWTVQSPYSEIQLPFVLNADGKVYVDYTMDLINAMELNEFDVHKDPREILINSSMFVPSYSLPYKIEHNKPIFFLQ